MRQLNFFDDLVPEPQPKHAVPADPDMNGFYYERLTDSFVSFALGTRHYQVSVEECEFPKEWQKRIKVDRAI
ncbi:hypothetical protein [Brevibacillus borstelensis]